jgi:serine/threonine-protein kinase HipA
VSNKLSITGVQKKLSVGYDNTNSKITVIGYQDDFILKLPSSDYPEIEFNEDLTMHLASIAGLKTVPHILIPLDNSYAYLTKRIDRTGRNKKHMEDFCQLSEKLTEYKYQGSHELIARKIIEFSELSNFDLLTLFDLTMFNYLVSNNDMHLKNYSLLYGKQISLSPAYDLLNTRLYINSKDDPDDFALSMNGKKSNFKLEDFLLFGKYLKLNNKQVQNIINKYIKIKPKLLDKICQSFLDDNLKEQYKNDLENRYLLFNSESNKIS